MLTEAPNAQIVGENQDQPRCGNCHFSRHAIGPNGAIDLAVLQCKIGRPPVFPVMSAQGAAFLSVRPQVHPSDWCGEHKPREF